MTDSILAFISQNFDLYLAALPRHIQAVVWFEAQGIGAISLIVLLLLMVRTFKQRRMSAMKTHYSMLIVNEVLNFSIEENCVSLLHTASKYSPIKNEALREALLDHMHLLTGMERKFVAQKYVELGFADRNLRDCDSHWWWKRLRATAELGNLGLPQYAPRIYDLIKDSNQYVAIAARIGLSSTAHPLNSPVLLKDLPPELMQRGNVLVEIAKNVGEIQGAETLVDFLSPANPPIVRESCLAALIALKSETTADVVTQLLQKEDQLTVTMIIRALSYLRKLNDSSHKPLVSTYLQHPDSQVRVEAAQWYLLFLDGPAAEEFQTLGFDLDARIGELAAKTLIGDAA